MRAVSKFTGLAAAAALTLLSVAGPAAGTAAGAAAAGGSWPETDFNAAASRANPGETTLTVRTVHQIRFLRQLTAAAVPPDNCANDGGFAAPVLTDGRLFAIANARLVSYNAATGRRLWQVVPDPTFTSNYYSLVVSDGLVIIAQTTCDSVSDPNGFVDAFRESTGAPVWNSGTSEPTFQAVVSDGYVVSAGGTSGSGQFIAVRRVSNGAVVWQKTPNNDQASAALVVGGLVIQQEAARLVAYRLATGARAWSRAGTWQPQRGDRAGQAARHFYTVNPAGQVADLSPRTGRTQRILTGATSVLAVDATRAYAICGTGRICAYRTTDGRLLWHLADNSALAAEAGGVLYLSDGHAINATNGALLRHIFTDPAGASQLAIGQGRIAASLGSKTLNLYGLPGS